LWWDRPGGWAADRSTSGRGIRHRCARIVGNLETVGIASALDWKSMTHRRARIREPRQIVLELVLSQHEIEVAINALRKAW
jgi:hypothetical protein